MGNRCERCCKFVSLELGDEPKTSLELNAEEITGSVRLVLHCGECGMEMLVSEVDVQCDVSNFEHDVPNCDGDINIEREPDIDTSNYYGAAQDWRGRFAPHFYRATLSVWVRCDWCEASLNYRIEAISQANNFEEC